MFCPTDCLRNQECNKKRKVPASLCVVEDKNSSEKIFYVRQGKTTKT